MTLSTPIVASSATLFLAAAAVVLFAASPASAPGYSADSADQNLSNVVVTESDYSTISDGTTPIDNETKRFVHRHNEQSAGRDQVAFPAEPTVAPSTSEPVSAEPVDETSPTVKPTPRPEPAKPSEPTGAVETPEPAAPEAEPDPSKPNVGSSAPANDDEAVEPGPTVG
ncbi:hypothetical protein [Leifsonia sp. Leaf264]|uniref:hypothetical protein n=1 Tax=Leifsonia sp. Leaf264 TaxID=1736314 RepID=UPI0006F320FF|nr:hypothetical protein [Leifsonia sp. Leaf264]KQO98501.1 hypothetical protein ASF30_10590 [Leifsonia sp. Leaf264]